MSIVHFNMSQQQQQQQQQQQHHQQQQRRQQQQLQGRQSPHLAALRGSKDEEQPQQQPHPPGVVTPELLVDALSGHEDGLLAIAERLMEHYDRGYDVMGEAIIDAFADVQRLFQHAVEAAHMEGAAMEANRLREARGAEEERKDDPHLVSSTSSSPSPPAIEEFVDDDVMEVLREAIQQVTKAQRASTTTSTSSTNATNASNTSATKQYMPWYEIYEKACQSASALLPVDSDHRGRLQLAIARSENVSPDRACAILRYAMEDVLRCTAHTNTTLAAFKILQQQPSSEQTSTTKPNTTSSVMSCTPAETAANNSRSMIGFQAPKISTRGDCVLDKLQSQQSSEEVLDSLLEEMKEVLSAPLYENSPIQKVAQKFWEVLIEERRLRSKKEEFLEDKLGKLKGEYLLEKAEWEELVSNSAKDVATWKGAYLQLKRQVLHLQQQSGIEQFIGSISYSGVGTFPATNNDLNDSDSLLLEESNSFLSSNRGKKVSGAASVISQASSSVAHHAKTMLTCGSNGGG